MAAGADRSTDTAAARNPWQRFWDRGGWWRAVLAVVLYLAVYEGLGWLNARTLASDITADELFATPRGAVVGVALPIIVMGLLTLVFVRTLGWGREVFGRQPLPGRGWMWTAVVLLLVPIVIRLVATNWSSYSVAVVFAVLFLGLCIGFAEELVARGVAVNLLRRGHHTERTVALLSSVLFGLMHASNAIGGTPLVTVAVTVVYTFGAGMMFYLSMRVTGSIVPAMLLHAATDPTTILATGGIDTTAATAGDAGLISLAGIFNFVYPVLALLVLFFIKGRVSSPETETETEPDPQGVAA